MAKNRADNLKPFKPGADTRRNKHGRPKKIPELETLINEVFGEPEAMRAIMEKLQSLAKAGNIRAAEMILDRAYGKPKQSIDHTTDGNALPASVSVTILTSTPPITSEDDISE